MLAILFNESDAETYARAISEAARRGLPAMAQTNVKSDQPTVGALAN